MSTRLRNALIAVGAIILLLIACNASIAWNWWGFGDIYWGLRDARRNTAAMVVVQTEVAQIRAATPVVIPPPPTTIPPTPDPRINQILNMLQRPESEVNDISFFMRLPNGKGRLIQDNRGSRRVDWDNDGSVNEEFEFVGGQTYELMAMLPRGYSGGGNVNTPAIEEQTQWIMSRGEVLEGSTIQWTAPVVGSVTLIGIEVENAHGEPTLANGSTMQQKTGARLILKVVPSNLPATLSTATSSPTAVPSPSSVATVTSGAQTAVPTTGVPTAMPVPTGVPPTPTATAVPPTATALLLQPSPTAPLPTIQQDRATRLDLGLWVWNGNRPPMPPPAQPGSVIVAHGDLTDSGACQVKVFPAGVQPGGLGSGTFRLILVTGSQPAIEAMVYEIQAIAASEAGGVCPIIP